VEENDVGGRARGHRLRDSDVEDLTDNVAWRPAARAAARVAVRTLRPRVKPLWDSNVEDLVNDVADRILSRLAEEQSTQRLQDIDVEDLASSPEADQAKNKNVGWWGGSRTSNRRNVSIKRSSRMHNQPISVSCGGGGGAAQQQRAPMRG